MPPRSGDENLNTRRLRPLRRRARMDSQNEERAPSMQCVVPERVSMEPSADALSTRGARPEH